MIANKVYTRDEMREEHIITTDYRFIDKEGEYFAKLIMRAEASKNMILFLGIQRTKLSKKSPSVGDGGRFLRRSYSPTYSASRSERSFASSFISR